MSDEEMSLKGIIVCWTLMALVFIGPFFLSIGHHTPNHGKGCWDDEIHEYVQCGNVDADDRSTSYQIGR